MVNDYSSEIDIPEKQVCDASAKRLARCRISPASQASSCALADSAASGGGHL
jgi:hypothetical protein